MRVDRLCSGILDFGSGRTSTFTCGTQLSPYQRVHILGDRGRIEIEIPFNAPPHLPTRIWVHEEQRLEEICFQECDQYTLQGDFFSLAILADNLVPTPIEDALKNMAVIEKLFASAREKRWV